MARDGRWAANVAALLLAGCVSSVSPDAPLRIEAGPAGPNTRLELIPAPGLKLNARLKPALDLPDGTVLRFDSPHLTPDSAYFTQPPTGILPGAGRSAHGTLHASVCEADALVCRTITLRL